MGLLNATAVAVVGQTLDRTVFPVNYQVVFLVLSLGGVIVYFATRRVRLPDAEPAPRGPRTSIREGVATYLRLVRGERAFVSFALKRFVFLSGMLLAAPLLPLYLVRDVGASDSWIGIISTTQTAVTLIGYYFWTWQSRVRGSRFVLLATTCAVALYPVSVGLTRRVELIVVFAGLAGIFQAGLNLVFFDELMKTVPPEQAPTFVSLAQNLRYLSVVVGPLLGTALADRIGLAGGLFLGAAVRLLGFLLFAVDRGERSPTQARAGF
jgi:predicted MFS family arabinose efflux permease